MSATQSTSRKRLNDLIWTTLGVLGLGIVVYPFAAEVLWPAFGPLVVGNR